MHSQVAYAMHLLSCQQIRAGLGELHIGAALVLPKPAARDRKIKPGFVFGRGAPEIVERPVDQLDEDAAVLHPLDRGDRSLEQDAEKLAERLGERAFKKAVRSAWRSLAPAS